MKELVIGYDLGRLDYPSILVALRVDDKLYILRDITEGEGVIKFPIKEEEQK